MSRPVVAVRRFLTWCTLLGCAVAIAFNLWLAVNGSWPGWVAAALLAILSAVCFRSLWRDPDNRKIRTPNRRNEKS